MLHIATVRLFERAEQIMDGQMEGQH